MFFFQEGFTYRNFLMDALAIFVFIVWFWLLITVAADLFRRHDISGWIKALWRVVGFSVADEIEKLNRLKQAGSISDAEFTQLRAKLVQ